jgi:Na+-transporting methylmalonyl-CoA/oxaloacetate decarboxylase beta subunit
MVGVVPTVLWRCESNKVFLKAGSEAFLLIHAMDKRPNLIGFWIASGVIINFVSGM